MVKRIEWSQKAIRELRRTIEYLKSEASITSAERFTHLIQNRIEQVSKHPTMGRKAPNRKTVRFVLFGKSHRLYYRVHGSTLYITALFDARQDPRKRPY
jgi:plasmid stabilization system protein ParE